MLCQSCIVTTHQSNVLHGIKVIYIIPSFTFSNQRFQKWTGKFFTPVSLFDLGAAYQLGHRIGESCGTPSRPVELTVFDVSGVTTVCVRYCYCAGSSTPIPPRVQLLCIRWFPATFRQPGTVFTFRLLDLLHKLQTRSKVNLYDVYTTLATINNPAGLKPAIVSMQLMHNTPQY